MDGLVDAPSGSADGRLNPPIRIAHVTAPGAFGGLETVIATLAKSQREAGHDVSVFSVVESNDQTPFLNSLIESGVKSHQIVVRGRQYLAEFRLLREGLRAFRPSVIHTHGSRSDVIGYAVARSLRCRVVSTSHGFTGASVKARLNEAIQRWVFRSFDVVVAVSMPMASLLARTGVSSSRIRIIRNVVAVAEPLSRAAAREVLGLAANAFVVGWVGRLSPEKGVGLLVDAIAQCRDLPLVASVLGDGVERSAAADQIERLGLRDRIRLHGAIPNAGRLLSAFDVLLLTSHTEGTPMVVLEALTVGVPVIATAVGGVPDLLSNGVGVLVPAGDVSALATAIRQTFNAPKNSAMIGAGTAVEAQRSTRDWMLLYDAAYRGTAPSTTAVLSSALPSAIHV